MTQPTCSPRSMTFDIHLQSLHTQHVIDCMVNSNSAGLTREAGVTEAQSEADHLKRRPELPEPGG